MLTTAYTTANSQILIAENLGHDVDSTQLIKGVWNFGFNAYRITNVIFNLNSGLDASMKWKRNEIIAAGKFKMLLRGEDRLLYGGFGHLRYRLDSEKKLTPETFAQYQWDPVRGIKSRYLFGQNIRFVAQHDSSGKINAAVGLMYEREHWDHNGVPEENEVPNPEEETRELIKTNLYISGYRNLSKSVSLMIVVYYQARPDAFFFKPRIAGDINFTVKLTKAIGLSTNFNYMYDAAPIVPIYRFYYTATNSLTLTF